MTDLTTRTEVLDPRAADAATPAVDATAWSAPESATPEDEPIEPAARRGRRRWLVVLALVVGGLALLGGGFGIGYAVGAAAGGTAAGQFEQGEFPGQPGDGQFPGGGSGGAPGSGEFPGQPGTQDDSGSTDSDTAPDADDSGTTDSTTS